MSITINDKGLEQGLDKLLRTIDQSHDAGLGAGAALLEAVDKSTTAYLGMSGATRASSFAAPLDERYSAKAQAAYSEAASLLAGFQGHSGKPLLEDSGVSLGVGEKGIILTTPTDYAADLEIERAGEKAHLGPTMSAEAGEVTRIIANFSRQALR